MPTYGGVVTVGKRGGANNKTVYAVQSACPLVIRVARGQKSRRANGGKTATGKKKER